MPGAGNDDRRSQLSRTPGEREHHAGRTEIQKGTDLQQKRKEKKRGSDQQTRKEKKRGSDQQKKEAKNANKKNLRDRPRSSTLVKSSPTQTTHTDDRNTERDRPAAEKEGKGKRF